MRDKNELPVDMIFHILVEKNLYSSNRRKFAKRFGLLERTDANKLQDKIDEFRDQILENKEKNLCRLAKSPRLIIRYIDHFRGGRLPEEAEKVFFEKAKNSPEYYQYCSKFGIIVDNLNQIITEVAMECDGIYHEKDYLEDILEKRKSCKQFIEQFIKFNELNKTDSIESLLAQL